MRPRTSSLNAYFICQPTKRTGEMSLIIVPCRATTGHRNTIHELVPFLGRYLTCKNCCQSYGSSSPPYSDTDCATRARFAQKQARLVFSCSQQLTVLWSYPLSAETRAYPHSQLSLTPPRRRLSAPAAIVCCFVSIARAILPRLSKENGGKLK